MFPPFGYRTKAAEFISGLMFITYNPSVGYSHFKAGRAQSCGITQYMLSRLPSTLDPTASLQVCFALFTELYFNMMPLTFSEAHTLWNVTVLAVGDCFQIFLCLLHPVLFQWTILMSSFQNAMPPSLSEFVFCSWFYFVSQQLLGGSGPNWTGLQLWINSVRELMMNYNDTVC